MKLRVVLAKRRRLKSSPGINKIEYKFAQFIKYIRFIPKQWDHLKILFRYIPRTLDQFT